MSKNTVILIVTLALFAAVVAAINVTRPKNTTDTQNSIIKPTQIVEQTLEYIDESCGVKFTYPANYEPLVNPAGGALLSDKTDPKKALVIICQDKIVPPNIAKEDITSFQIGSVSGKLYRDFESENKVEVRKLIFTNPKSKKQVYIAASSGAWDDIEKSIELY